ncbi:hypothetical protein FRB99_007445 [Tulasnella sp. 403]|nr:hypothetical protein FRB99_007445 [Tulasnella sp. 403]
MRSLLLVAAAAIQRHLGLPIFNPTERFVDADQPLSFVFGGWSWSQSFIDVVDHEPIISFISRPASFGPHITEQPGLPGYLIPVSSLATQCPDTNTPITPSILTDDDDLPENFSCLPICTDPSVSRPGIGTENWIALVQRGRCPFAEKVRAAQLLGAKAVVVGGWKPKEGDRDDLLNMFSPDDTSNITIPSTYVTYRSYTHLMGLIAASNTTTSGSQTISIIVRAEESWGWFSPIFTFLMLLLLPSFLTFLTLVIHRLREARRERLDRAPEDVVSHLPTRIWSGKGWEKEGDWLKKLRKRTQDEQDPGLEPSDKHIDDTSYDLERQDSARSMETCLEDSECVDHRGAPNAPHPEVHAHHDEECAIVDGTTTPSDDDIPGHDQPWFNGQIECEGQSAHHVSDSGYHGAFLGHAPSSSAPHDATLNPLLISPPGTW